MLTLACVALRFWLGALSNKGGRGQRNREEIGAEATFYFSRGFAREFRGYAAPAPGSTKPPCYAGYANTLVKAERTISGGVLILLIDGLY